MLHDLIVGSLTLCYVAGAMYAFPMVSMPRRFLAEAGALGKDPDLLYCIKMLEAILYDVTLYYTIDYYIFMLCV